MLSKSKKSLGIACICIIGIIVAIYTSFVSTVFTPGTRDVILTPTNHYYFFGEVNERSSADVIEAIMRNKEPELFIFLLTPGGSIMDGLDVVEAIKASKNKITCIASEIASMGFVIFQACHERIIMENSVLMQHTAAFGIPHMPELHFEQYYKRVLAIIAFAEEMQANRMRISRDEFRSLVRDDLWLYGTQAFDLHAADTLGTITCSDELLKRTTEITFPVSERAEVTAIVPACPLIRKVLSTKEIRVAPTE